jgi:hypothetical protein
MNPQYPIYIISKGRADSRLTSKSLEAMRVPYRIVVEPEEYDQYAAVIDKRKILVLPFSNLGQGSIPARNWVWEHSIVEGHPRHWILDDNINGFYRFNHNRKIKVGCGTIFRLCEEFVDRYTNVPMAGMNYRYFSSEQRNPDQTPMLINTRVYSCILLANNIPHRWRGRYNEDTDLSLRVLKSGYCTIVFNAFLCGKITTLAMKGGNTDELYKDDGRLKMAQSLKEQHPDVTEIKWKWNRWQHQVDYRPFRGNKLIKKPGVEIPSGVNEFGMVLVDKRKSNGRTTDEI